MLEMIVLLMGMVMVIIVQEVLWTGSHNHDKCAWGEKTTDRR